MLDNLNREDGMSLVEVLVVSAMMLVILGVTLQSFNTFEANARASERQNEAQDSARRGMELLARDLRNLASPTPGLPFAVDVAAPTDVIFQSEGKFKPPASLNAQNTTRVRYCLHAAKAILYRQIQTWTTADPPAMPTAACGDAAWGSTMVVATNVVNGSRPIFTYNATMLDSITEVSAQLFVDTNPGVRPGEVDLQTSVFLRNQNRAPTAIFSALSMPGGGVFLNASESADPEEKALIFEWWDADLVPASDCPDAPPSTRTGCKVGDGIVFTYSPPAPGNRQMYLVVKDATLETTSDTKTVCANGPGVTCP